MFIRIVLVLLLFALPAVCYSQGRALTKEEIKKVFKESTETSLQDIWITCNKDSLYYKSNIIKLYNNINYFYDRNQCCNHISWKFSTANKLRLTQTLICQEPGLDIFSHDDVYHVRIRNENQHLMLQISNGIKKIIFKIVSLDTVKLWNDKDDTLVLILERV